MSQPVSLRHLLFGWGLLVVLLAVSAEAAEAPFGQLAELVPETAGLCIELRDGAAKFRQFQQSEFHDRLKDFPPFVGWLREHGDDLGRLAQQARQHLDVPVLHLIHGLLGQDVLVAVWPAASAQPDAGSGVLLINAADADVLRVVADKIVAIQQREGRLRQPLTIDRHGRQFTAHVIRSPGDRPPLYLCVDGHLGIVSTDQALLEQVLDRRAEPGRYASLASSPVYLSALEQLSADTMVRLYLNPRTWDALIDNLAPKSAKAARPKLPGVWRAVDYVVAGIQVSPDMALELHWAWHGTPLPEPLAFVVDALGGVTGLLDRVPHDALIAGVGRLDGRVIFQNLAEAGFPGANDAEKVLAAVLVSTIASGCGPDVGGFVLPGPTATDTSQRRRLPLDAVIFANTQSLDGHADAAADQFVPLMRKAITLAVNWYNARQRGGVAALDTQHETGGTSSSLHGVRELGPLEPTMASQGNTIWLGSSPGAVDLSVQLTPAESLVAADKFLKAVPERWHQPSHLLLADLEGIRHWLQTHQAALAWMAMAKGLDAEETRRGEQQLRALLSLADTLVVAGTMNDHGGSFTGRLVTRRRLAADDAAAR